jgi:actin-related protein 8
MRLRAGASTATVIYFGNRIADTMANRLQAIATPLVSNMDKVQIIPPPKGVDPRVLVWKGAAVLGKMDGVSDLWLTATEWVSIRSYSPMHVFFVLWRLLIYVGPLGDTGTS